MLRLLLILGGFAIICGFAGCATSSGDLTQTDALDDAALSEEVLPPSEPGLIPALQQRFADIPLPANAREDLDRTYVYQAQGLELGRMVYTSRASVQELAQFYIREMPASDWTLESVTQADSGVGLLFTKPGKRLDVAVNAVGVGRARELVLHLVPVPHSGGQP